MHLAVRVPHDRAAAGDVDLRVDDLDHGDRARPAASDRGLGAGAPGGHGQGRRHNPHHLDSRHRNGQVRRKVGRASFLVLLRLRQTPEPTIYKCGNGIYRF